MDQSRADAVADAVLRPDPAAREALLRRRAAEERSLADRRMVAWVALPACALGGAVAHLAGHHFTVGTVWGGVAGAVLAWGFVAWRRRAGR